VNSQTAKAEALDVVNKALWNNWVYLVCDAV